MLCSCRSFSTNAKATELDTWQSLQAFGLVDCAVRKAKLGGSHAWAISQCQKGKLENFFTDVTKAMKLPDPTQQRMTDIIQEISNSN